MSETYPQPKEGWTCFHCGENFKTYPSARDHFGFDPSKDPACRIKAGAEYSLLKALRVLEDENARAWSIIHDEDGQAARALNAQATRHATQLRAAEELGYERGLADGRKLGADAA